MMAGDFVSTPCEEGVSAVNAASADHTPATLRRDIARAAIQAAERRLAELSEAGLSAALERTEALATAVCYALARFENMHEGIWDAEDWTDAAAAAIGFINREIDSVICSRPCRGEIVYRPVRELNGNWVISIEVDYGYTVAGDGDIVGGRKFATREELENYAQSRGIKLTRGGS